MRKDAQTPRLQGVEINRIDKNSTVESRQMVYYFALMKPTTTILSALTLLASAGLMSCGGGEEPVANAETAPAAEQPSSALSADAIAAADAKFNSLCVVCHGKTGLGDGAGAAALNPKPQSYADSAWQASVTDEYLAEVILKGGAAMGKSPTMPPNPDLQSKPEVIKALVAKVRSFAK